MTILYPEETDAALTRRMALRGKALWTSLAFYIMLAAVLAIGAPTLLAASTWAKAALTAAFEFYGQVQDDTNGLSTWFKHIAAVFPQLRGEALASPPQWLSLFVIASVLFLADRSRFTRPRGTSLLADARSAPLTRSILQKFGFYTDIRYTEVNDIIVFGSILFPWRGRVSRIIEGKPSALQQDVLRFFMVHEYVHVLYRDNLANSLFRLVLYWITALLAVYLALFVGATSMIIVPLAGTPLLFAFLSFLLACGAMLCLVFSSYGVIIAYIKSREFYADAAGYELAGADLDPYNFAGALPRPGFVSAWSRNISRHERFQHRCGTSLHARNLFPGALVLHAALRSVFMLVAPPELVFWVLAFDAAMAMALVISWRSLPSHAAPLSARPLAPWLVASGALLTLTLSTIGLLGYLVYFMGLPSPGDAYRYLLSWPLLLEFSVCILMTLRLLLARRPPTGPVAETAILRRIGWFALALPGLVPTAFTLVMLIMFASSALSGTFSAWPDTTTLAVGLVASALLLTAAALLYRNLLVRSFGFFVFEVALSSFFLFASTTLLAAVLTRLLSVQANIPATEATAAVAAAIAEMPSEQWAGGARFGSIVALLYIVFRLMEYWARGKLQGPGGGG